MGTVGAANASKTGSAQQSVRVCILRGFLEIDGPAPGTARHSDFPAEWLRTNNHAAERTPAVEMAGRGNRGNVQTRPFPDSPHPWKSRTKRGIPTFPPRRRRRTAFTPNSEEAAKIEEFYRFSLRTLKLDSLTSTSTSCLQDT